MRLVLLPGMDGGSALVGPFCAALPRWIVPEAVAYPPDEKLGYDALARLVRERIASSPEPTAMLAESFSGPIAIRIAADPPSPLAAVVLVATFVRPPAPSWLRHFVVAPLFWRTPPRAVIRRFFVGADAPDALVDDVVRAMRAPRPEVLSHRARALLSVDATAELARIALPLLSIEGARDLLIAPNALGRPPSQRVILDAPHLVLEREPARSAALVSDFLAAHGFGPR